MRSWIFRHRLRLRAIYGPRPAPAPAPTRAGTMPAHREPPERLGGLRPGEGAFHGEHYVLRPMRRGAA
ncbi:MAG: hypothetical protein U1F29_11110 [Planctomycetota bacterium]